MEPPLAAWLISSIPPTFPGSAYLGVVTSMTPCRYSLSRGGGKGQGEAECQGDPELYTRGWEVADIEKSRAQQGEVLPPSATSGILNFFSIKPPPPPNIFSEFKFISTIFNPVPYNSEELWTEASD